MPSVQILIVEDAKIVALDIQRNIEKLGYSVAAIVSSGEEAIRQAGEARPDLILMDIILKGDMDGIQAAGEIRDRFNIPVIYLTAYGDDQTVQRAKVTEPFGYIHKPVDMKELHTAIELALYWHEMERERRRAGEALRHDAERLRILHEINQVIIASQSAEAIAQAALRRILPLIPCQRAGVVMFDFEAQEATVLAAHGRGETHVGAGAHAPLDSFGIEALRQGGVHMIEDLPTSSELPSMFQSLRAEGLRSYMAFPLIVEEELIGCLVLWADSPGAFAPEQVRIAREVANPLATAIQQASLHEQVLAIAIHQARLHEQVQRYAADLEQRVAERTAELGEVSAELEAFAASTSADLRTHLRAIEGFAQTLLEDYADRLDPVGQDYARRIVAAAQRMDAQIHDLLAYSQSRGAQRAAPADSAGGSSGARVEPARGEDR